MPVFTTSFLGRETIARGTAAIELARPEGFAFTAGQAVNLTLVEPPETDAKGNSRTFSIASAPFEPTLRIATRMRDTAFKRVLGTLAPGAAIKLRGPMGKFTLPEDESHPVVMLAGGIGITPFMSMLREEERRASNRPRLLVYSNRTREDAPFLRELEAMAERGAGFRLVAAMSNAGGAGGASRGIADPGFLSRHLAGAGDSIHYLAGPPAMVGSLRQALAALEVPEARIRTDEFYGY